MARKCKHCKNELPKVKECNPVEKAGFCSIDHMAKHGIEKAAKAKQDKAKKEHKAAKERLKTRGDYAKDTQAVFNKFIRLRDRLLPCISCDRHHKGQYHAGHYRTVGGNPELRYEELNCHKQCSVCNNHKSGNIVEYRINLTKRIGNDNLDWLEGPHKPKKYTIEELKAIKARYSQKCKELEVLAND